MILKDAHLATLVDSALYHLIRSKVIEKQTATDASPLVTALSRSVTQSGFHASYTRQESVQRC